MKTEGGLRNQLKAIRNRLRLSQQELATAAGVARQTIGGIEAELYAPSAVVALRLAKALGCRVEELFWLEDESPVVEAVSITPLAAGQPTRVLLAQVGGRWIAHPLVGEQAFRPEMVPADGLASGAEGQETLSVRLLDDPEALSRTVLMAGCTPALSLWARSAERWYPGLRVPWMHANSMTALARLAAGEIHAAGLHLCDPRTGESNAPYVRQRMVGRAVTLVNLGIWEEGLLVPAGNPKGLRSGADLAQGDITLINREEGAGSRLLLDTALHEAGIPPSAVKGYERLAYSHQEVAQTLSAGKADVGVSTASVAALYGLSFISLRSVRYDLALLRASLSLPPVQQLLDTLHHRWVRSQLQLLGGYDTARTGDIVAEL